MTPEMLDITIAIVILLSGIIAYFRGLIREIFTILSLIVATTAAYAGGDMMIPSFDKWLHVDHKAGAQAAEAVTRATAQGTDAGVASKNLIFGVADPALVSIVCAYASVFVFFYLVMALVGYFVTRAVAESGLGIVDKLLGAAFGLARGFAVVFLIYLPIAFLIKVDDYAWAQNSISVPILEKTAAYVNEHVDLQKMVTENGSRMLQKVKKIDFKKAKNHGKAAAEDAAPEQTDETRNNRTTTPEDEQNLQQELMQDEKTPGAPQ